MIKVTSSSVTNSEVELIVTAARFFLERLLPPAQQKKLRLNIDVTDRPGRTPIAIKWLVGSSGFFGWKPPRHFVMTISVAAGVKDGLEFAANEIVHVAQTVSGRLKISLKNRKVSGKREDAYAASWMNGRFAFVDMIPRDNRLWETEAHQLKTQLINEFLAWSAGRIKKFPTQNPRRNGYGLYAIRSEIIAEPVTIPVRPAPAVDEMVQLNDGVDLPSQKLDLAVDALVVEELEGGQLASDDLSPVSDHESLDTVPSEKTSPLAVSMKQTPAQQLKDHHVMVNHLDIESDEFKIAVHVPRLGTDRMLDSVMLHGKLNELLERGLIPHDAALAALRQAKQNFTDR